MGAGLSHGSRRGAEPSRSGGGGLPRGPALPGAALDAHENVAVIERERVVEALASTHLLIADAPAARAAAAALGIPAIAPGAPAAVLQQAERVLDGGDVAAPIKLAA